MIAMPVGAVDYVELHELKGPALGPDYWGGYLIYRMYPGTKVVIDDRHDFYGAAFLQSYLRTMHVEPGWEEFLKATDPGYAVLPRTAALATMLPKTPEWKQVYADETAVVFIHAGDVKGSGMD